MFGDAWGACLATTGELGVRRAREVIWRRLESLSGDVYRACLETAGDSSGDLRRACLETSRDFVWRRLEPLSSDELERSCGDVWRACLETSGDLVRRCLGSLFRDGWRLVWGSGELVWRRLGSLSGDGSSADASGELVWRACAALVWRRLESSSGDLRKACLGTAAELVCSRSRACLETSRELVQSRLQSLFGDVWRVCLETSEELVTSRGLVSRSQKRSSADVWRGRARLGTARPCCELRSSEPLPLLRAAKQRVTPHSRCSCPREGAEC